MIIAVASRKASPGVTSLTAWLADLWSEPGVTRLIVEADPSGGSLAARWSSAHGLTWDPGLLTLSTSRAALSADTLGSLTQRLADGVLVAAAPPAPEQVFGALSRWGDRGAAELAAADGVRAFVDCGRLTSASPALTLARRAALTVLVCRPRLDEVNALVPAVAELTAAGCTLGLVCVGSEPYLPAEIANAAGLPLLGVLPVDTRAAAVFDRDGLESGRSFRRSALAQTAAELTEYVRSRAVELLAGHGPADTGPGVAADPGGDPTTPDPAPPAALDPAPVVAAPAAPGPTRLSNPVGPATDDGTAWPPPRPAAAPVPIDDGAPPPPAPAREVGPDTAVVAAPPPPPSFAAPGATADATPPPPPSFTAPGATADTAPVLPPPAGQAGPDTAAVTMPPPPPPPPAPPAVTASAAPYPGAAATSPLPAGGMPIPSVPTDAAVTQPPPWTAPARDVPAPADGASALPPPPSALFDVAQAPPPPPPGWASEAPGAAAPDLSQLPPPPAPEGPAPEGPAPEGPALEGQVIPVSLAIAAARARAQGQVPTETPGDEAWPPPPPPPPPPLTGGPAPGPPTAS